MKIRKGDLMKSHKDRVEKIRETIDNNKVFSVVVVVLLFIIIGSIVTNKVSDYMKHKSANDTSISEEQTAADANIIEMQDDVDTSINDEETAVDTNINNESKIKNEKPHWRFYWIDLWILLGGGGFCLIKILQEKKKAREKL